MADNVVQVIIRAKDEAKSQLASISAQLSALGKSAGPLSGAFEKVSASIGSIPIPAVAAASAILGITTAGAAVGKVLVEAAIEGGRFADDMATLADRAGTTAESFSRLSFAAGQFDASSQSVSAALKFLNKNIFEAQNGSKEAEVSFRALGLAASDLAKLDAGEAFIQIADRLAQVKDQSTRTGLALRIFGRGAEELNPVFAAGGEAIRGFGDELDHLGGTVTTRAGQIGDNFDNAGKRLNAAVTGMKVNLSEVLLPALTSLIDVLSGAAAWFNEFARAGIAALKPIEDMRVAVSALQVVAKNLADDGIDRLTNSFAASLPIFGEFIRLAKALQVLDRVKRPSADTPAEVQGPPTGPPGDPLKVIRDFEAQQKAAAEAEKAAEAYRKKMADLRAEFEKAVAVAFSIPDGVAEKLFAIDPAKAAGAVAALQKEIEKLDAIPIGVSADGAKLLASIQTEIAKTTLEISVELDPAKRAEMERDLKALEERAQRVGSGLRQPTGQPVPTPNVIGERASQPIEVNLPTFGSGAIESATAMEEIAAQIGVTVEALIDSLVAARTELGSLIGDVVVLGEAIGEAMKISFDPLRRGIADAQRAVFDFAETSIKSLDAAIESFVINAGNGFKTVGNLMKSLGEAVAELVKQVIILTIRTLILKAIGIGFLGLSGGGEVQGPVQGSVRGGIAAPPRLSMGGMVPRLAAGGMLAASMFAAPVHAAGGLFTVPGSPQRHDSVPAILAPGEVVLPFVNGQRPADILQSVTRLPSTVTEAIHSSLGRGSSEGSGQAFIGQLHIHALDSDSIANSARNGELEIQLQRMAELGR